MRDRDDGTRIVVEELLEPGDGLGVQVVGRLVQQQHVRLGQEQAAQGDAAAFAAGQFVDLRIPVRQAQGIGRHFEFAVDFPAVRRVDLVLQLALFFEQRGHFVVVQRFGETFADLVETLHEARACRRAPSSTMVLTGRSFADRAPVPAAGSRS